MNSNSGRSLRYVSTFTLCIIILTKCVNEQKKKLDNGVVNKNSTSEGQRTPVDYNTFAGSGKCVACHRDISEKHRNTSHFSTSAEATQKNIKGSFAKGKNIFTYNPELFIAVEKRDSGLCQVVFYQGQEKIALKFGLTMGSGTKGQSFARWENDKLFQMPLTYYSVDKQWANSPGFPNKVQYQRPITSRCMECHATYAKVKFSPPDGPEEFNRQTIITGITCEKCHGPGKEHVAFHSAAPNEKEGKYILNPAKMSRQQNLDLCALCHGGRLEQKQPAFSYVVGDTLSHFFNTQALNKTGRGYVAIDVHGNQYGLMSASKCFLKSDMTCNTCHDPHENERGETKIFSDRCQTCHSGEHKNTPQLATIPPSVIKSNCVDCHMALEQSHTIVLSTSGMETPKAASFRSHFITVYTKETENFIEALKKN